MSGQSQIVDCDPFTRSARFLSEIAIKVLGSPPQRGIYGAPTYRNFVNVYSNTGVSAKQNATSVAITCAASETVTSIRVYEQ